MPLTPITNSPMSVQENFSTACGNDPSPFRPYVGFGSITAKSYRADSILQFAAGVHPPHHRAAGHLRVLHLQPLDRRLLRLGRSELREFLRSARQPRQLQLRRTPDFHLQLRLQHSLVHPKPAGRQKSLAAGSIPESPRSIPDSPSAFSTEYSATTPASPTALAPTVLTPM